MYNRRWPGGQKGESLFNSQAFNLIADVPVRENVNLPLTYSGMQGSGRKQSWMRLKSPGFTSERQSQEARATWGGVMWSLIRDFRYSYRLLFRDPGFAAVALFSLALGIGANTTIFSVLNAVLLRPFPVKEPERLVILEEQNLQERGTRVPTVAAYEEWKQQSKVFEGMALTPTGGGGAGSTLTWAKEAVQIQLSDVSTDFFSVVGVAPVLGRAFLAEDAPPGSPRRALVVSHEFWQRVYGGDKDILGQTVAVDGRKVTIVGVMPPGFWLFPWASRTDAWLPRNIGAPPNTRWRTPIGRLKPGATLEQARAEMRVLFRRLAEAQPGVYKGWDIQVESLHEWSVGGSRRTLYLLLGAVGFVLLIACTNVANLLLARASTRQKEIAVRASLGASRLRIVRQLLTESLLLAAAGGALSVLVVRWGISVFVALAPQWFPRTADMTIDTTVLGFTLLLSLVTGFIFGLAPALQASRPDLSESLKEAGGRSTGGSRVRGRNVLVVTEIALTMVLLAGAGLMVNSFVRLQSVDLGYDPKNILKADVFLAGPKYMLFLPGDMKRVTPQGDVFFERMLEEAGSLPGVVSAGIGRVAGPRAFRLAGAQYPTHRDWPWAAFADVSPGYFRTMGIPLLRGRLLSDADVDGAPGVVVVSESFVRRFLANEDPLGKVLHTTVTSAGVATEVEEGRAREIVGVVKDIRYRGPRVEPPPVIYSSYRQHPWEYPGGAYSSHLWTRLLLRTAAKPTTLTAAVERLVAGLDKDQLAFDIMSLQTEVDLFVAPQRFWMRLFGIFAALAMILAMGGIYGVMSYSVSRRRHEIGVRMATGARRWDILKLVIVQGLKLALAGVAIGVAGSLALTRLVARFLYEVKPADPLTFTVVALVVIVVALGAAYIPARRATKIGPMVALRHE